MPKALRWSIIPIIVVLLCALVAAILLRQRPAELYVRVGELDDHPYVAGVYTPEQTGAIGAYRWTTPLVQLRAPGTAFQPAMVLLRAGGFPDPTGPERPVMFGRNERAINVLALNAGWRDYHLLAPRAGALEAWDDVPLTLSITPLPRTANDGRDLGLALARFRLLPVELPHIPWPMLASIALLVVAAAALWQLDRLLNLPAAWRGWRVAGIIGTLALPMLLWASRSAYTFNRSLPPLPWTIGLTALVLGLSTRRRPAHESFARATAGLAVSLMLLGIVLLNWPVLAPVGAGLAAIGVLLFPPLRGVDIAADRQSWPDQRMAMLALAAIVVLAFGLRLYRIRELPYGLWRDGARYGLEALRMLREADYRPAFVERVDLPGLGLLPFSWAVGVWGIQTWTLRTATAVAGALTVVPLYGLATILTRSRAIGLLAALLFAASHWNISLSRIEFPTVFDPLLELTAYWLLLQAIASPGPLKRGLGVLGAGACLGLAMHTYHPARLGVPLASAFAISYWAANPARRRGWPLVLGLLVGAWVLTAFPLLEYALQNPERVNTRVGSVSLLGEQEYDWHSTIGKLDRSLGGHIMMWWLRGDQNGRHVAPSRPMLDTLTGLGLLIGLVVVLRGLGDWRKRCLLLGLLFGLLPSALAVDYPHANRSVNALGFACMIAALGLSTAAQLVVGAKRTSEPGSFVRRSTRVVPWIAVCGLVVTLNAWVYFVAMPPDPAVWQSVYPYHTQVGGYLRQLADEQGADAVRDVYVPAGLERNSVFEFLAYELEPKTYQPNTPAQAAPGSRFVVISLLKPSEIDRIVQQQRLDPASAVDGPALPDGSGPAFVVYRVSDE